MLNLKVSVGKVSLLHSSVPKLFRHLKHLYCLCLNLSTFGKKKLLLGYY